MEPVSAEAEALRQRMADLMERNLILANLLGVARAELERALQRNECDRELIATLRRDNFSLMQRVSARKGWSDG